MYSIAGMKSIDGPLKGTGTALNWGIGTSCNKGFICRKRKSLHLPGTYLISRPGTNLKQGLCSD